MIDNFVQRVYRAKKLLWFHTFEDVCKLMVEDGTSKEDAYLATVAARILLKSA